MACQASGNRKRSNLKKLPEPFVRVFSDAPKSVIASSKALTKSDAAARASVTAEGEKRAALLCTRCAAQLGKRRKT